MSRIRVLVIAVTFLLMASALSAFAMPGSKDAPPGSREALEAIFSRRAQWLVTGETPSPLEYDYVADLDTAKWAITHERSKIDYLRQWAEGRGIRIVEAEPSLQISFLKGGEDRVRFYVAQRLALGYLYEGEHQRNKFGVGSRHIVELQRDESRWAIRMEWYADPLGGDNEVPASATVSEQDAERLVVPVAWRGYNREKAVRYADTYCGLAAGCGNKHRYNLRFRDYSGEGGNCSNFASQALRAGGLNMPLIIRADHLVAYLTGSGRAGASFRGPFPAKWKEAVKEGGFPAKLQEGDLIAYQLKGKMEHIAIVTSFDSHGYPLVNSHTADRYHVPFDLGWDKKTIFWFLKIW